MKKKPLVLLDVDGILADFIGSVLDIIKKETGIEFYENNIKTFEMFEDLKTSKYNIKNICYKHFKKPKYALKLKLLDGSVQAVERIKELADIHVVTTPMHMNPTWTFEREQWLKKHFNIDYKDITFTSKKYLLKGDVLIDDNEFNVRSWSKENPNSKAFLWSKSYNEHINDLEKVSNWKPIIEYIEKINK